MKPSPRLRLKIYRIPDSYAFLAARMALLPEITLPLPSKRRRHHDAVYKGYKRVREQQRHFRRAVGKADKDLYRRLFAFKLSKECPPAGVITHPWKQCDRSQSGCPYCWARHATDYYRRFAAVLFRGWLPGTTKKCDLVKSQYCLAEISVNENRQSEWSFPKAEKRGQAARRYIAKQLKPYKPIAAAFLIIVRYDNDQRVQVRALAILRTPIKTPPLGLRQYSNVTPAELCGAIGRMFSYPYFKVENDVLPLAERFAARLNAPRKGRILLLSATGAIRGAKLADPRDLVGRFKSLSPETQRRMFDSLKTKQPKRVLLKIRRAKRGTQAKST